jgi:hypothetical protein
MWYIWWIASIIYYHCCSALNVHYVNKFVMHNCTFISNYFDIECQRFHVYIKGFLHMSKVKGFMYMYMTVLAVDQFPISTCIQSPTWNDSVLILDKRDLALPLLFHIPATHFRDLHEHLPLPHCHRHAVIENRCWSKTRALTVTVKYPCNQQLLDALPRTSSIFVSIIENIQ